MIRCNFLQGLKNFCEGSSEPPQIFENLRWLWTPALTIWMEFSVIPRRIEMERFILVENFRKKGNTFRGISFFSLLPEFPKILLKIWKMAADFQNVYRYNVSLCSSVVLADVWEHNNNPAGENELRLVVGTCVFLLLPWGLSNTVDQIPVVSPSSRSENRNCRCVKAY